jgi:hypothetical protein
VALGFEQNLALVGRSFTTYLSHSTSLTWMNPKDIMLSEIYESQKDKYCMISLIWGISVVKTLNSEMHKIK